jgi:EmrB/QacA subfamily drug resistance transporter
MKVSTAAQIASTFTKKQRSIALVIVALAFVMDLLDATIVNVAIPSIQANIHATYAAIQWIVAGYSMAFAILLITGGRLGDIFGYKKIFLVGTCGFTIASLLNGITPNDSVLIASRILQGATAAMMVPQVMSLMQVMYSAEERTKVMGIFGMLGGLAGSLGPIIGGVLIKANIFGLDWRPIFLINIPVGVFAMLAAIKYLPGGKSEHAARLDMTGTGLVMAALTLLILPLIQGYSLGWPTWTFAMLVAAVPASVIFIYYELRRSKRIGSALIVPALFRQRTFVSGISLNLLLQVAMVGFFLTFTLCLQEGLGFDALKAALTALPVAFGIGFSLGLSQQLIPKLGRKVILLGGAILAGGFIYTSWILNGGLAANPWEFIPGLLLVGFGMGTIMGPVFSVALQDIDVKHAGAASGMLSAIQQVGSAVGVAIIGVIFFGHITRSTSHTAMIITREAANAHNFAVAYRASIVLELTVLILLCILSFTLPRHFKTTSPEVV